MPNLNIQNFTIFFCEALISIHPSSWRNAFKILFLFLTIPHKSSTKTPPKPQVIIHKQISTYSSIIQLPIQRVGKHFFPSLVTASMASQYSIPYVQKNKSTKGERRAKVLTVLW